LTDAPARQALPGSRKALPTRSRRAVRGVLRCLSASTRAEVDFTQVNPNSRSGEFLH